MTVKRVYNLKTESSKEVPYFLPTVYDVPVGTAWDPQPDDKAVPPLFKPLKIGQHFEVANRVGLSPMCTYSAAHSGKDISKATPWHLVHYGSIAARGPGLLIVESTAAAPEGRLSPEDLGIYTDEQATSLVPIVELAHAHGAKIGIQIGHGGRKSSGTAIFNNLAKGVGTKDFGWSDVPGAIVAPSAESFATQFYVTPHELSIDEIEAIVQKFKEAAERAYKLSGFDFVEIHGAHGYLISTFLSATSNKRTDKYGGSFENRIRLLLEIIDAVKSPDHPTFLRISASENAPAVTGSWTIEDSIRLSDYLIEHGVTLLDVSSGGISAHQQKKEKVPGYQVPLAKAIKQHVGDRLLVATVGNINDAELANNIIKEGSADVVLVGSQFLKNPGLVWKWADDLSTTIAVPGPYEWPFVYPPLG